MSDTDGAAPVAPTATPSEVRGSSFSEACAVWLRAHVHDLAIVISLAALCLMQRLATLDPVNTGGDAATKYQFVREWFYAHDFAHAEWNHHMTRFGVLVPAYFAQRFFGHGLRGYYAAPLAACLVQVAFVYACGKRLSGRFAGVLAAVLLTYASLMATAGSQLLPDLFSGTYGIVMTYLYLRYADAAGRERMAWLVGSALVAFAGYLAKETFVFFFPGMAIAVFLAARDPVRGIRATKWRELVVFFGVLLVGLTIETLAYRSFTAYHSRLSIVFSSHVGNSDEGGRPDTTFWKLFDRYLHIDKGWAVAFYVFLPCWLGLLGLVRNYRMRALLAVVASFFFFLTFLVRGLNPMLLWHRFMSRYLDPSAPFVELVTALFVALALRQLWQEFERPALSRLANRVQPFGGAFVAIGCALIVYSGYSDWKGDTRNAFSKGSELSSIANDTYRRNLPIFIRKTRAADVYARDVAALYSIYIDPRDELRNGRLPSFDEAKRVTGNLTYLVKDPAAYPPSKVTQLISAGCALEVRETTPSMTAAPWATLPPSCDATARE